MQTLSDLEVRLGQVLTELMGQGSSEQGGVKSDGVKMKDVFRMFDKNGDDKVSKMEFRQQACRGAWARGGLGARGKGWRVCDTCMCMRICRYALSGWEAPRAR